MNVPISTVRLKVSSPIPLSAELLGSFAGNPPTARPVVHLAWRLARHHEAQWLAEDRARLLSHDDAALAAIKRQIDAMNIVRSEFIDEIDGWVAEHVRQSPTAPVHTETLGSVIDRLCIASVRADRLEADSGIESRGEIARFQLAELASAYDLLVQEVRDGSRRVPDWKTLKSYGRSATGRTSDVRRSGTLPNDEEPPGGER